MKRGRDEFDENDTHQNGTSEAEQASEHRSTTHAVDQDDDDLDQPVQPIRRAAQVKKGNECPYLDTVTKQVSAITALSHHMQSSHFARSGFFHPQLMQR